MSIFTHLGLFEGIGGFGFAVRSMGWETLAYSELDKFCLKVLAHHFPNAESLGDITKTDFKKYANKIDIVTGGFPCQPFSLAGKRSGTHDERYLWGEMLRAIIQIEPTYVVGENVLGIVNWNEGLVFEQVQTDLENQGFEVQAVVLPACGINAPHKRERTWFVAYSHANANKRTPRKIPGANEQAGLQESEVEQFDESGKFWISANTNPSRQQECWQERFTSTEFAHDYGLTSQPSIRRGDDGFSHRVDRLRGLGNAIVPQVALQIFQSIMDVHAVKSKDLLLFEIPPANVNTCKDCKHRQRHQRYHGASVFQYCGIRSNNRTHNGLFKIQCKTPACAIFERVLN